MHLILAFYASPMKIKQLEEVVNKHLTYEVQGQVRKGLSRPFLSKLPFGLYDIRCERQVAGMILRDLEVNTIRSPKLWWRKSFHGNLDMSNSNRAGWLIEWGIFILRKLMRLKYHEAEHGPSKIKYLIPGWHYAWLIGAHPDALSPDGREIL